MFCPRCAHERVSDETNYCPGCGFLLTDVVEALENDGVVVRTAIENKRELTRSASVGLVIIILSGLFCLIGLILGTPEPSFFVQFNLLVGLLGFLLGVTWIAYTFWLRPDKNLSKIAKAAPKKPPAANNALSEARQEFVSAASPKRTNELSSVPSVTEHTTSLLNDSR